MVFAKDDYGSDRSFWTRRNRKFNNIYVSLALLCCAVTFQSMMASGALGASISTIQKYFKYRSFQVAFINTAYNTGVICFSLVLGYSIKSHKLKWVGLGCLMITAGCILFVLPVFIKNYDKTPAIQRIVLCQAKDEPTGFENCSFVPNLYLLIKCLAYFLIGVGSAPLHSAAISFLEENSPKEKFGLFSGIYYACGAIGTLASFIISSFFFRIPILIRKPDDIFLSDSNPNWIGAYWLIYVIGGTLTFILSIPLFLFPSTTNEQMLIDNVGKVKRTLLYREVLKKTQAVFKNVPFVITCAGMFFDGLMINALSLFMTKYIESQFSFSPKKASLITGLVLVPSSILGLGLGGVISKKLPSCPKKFIEKIAIISLFTSLFLGFLFLRCPSNELHGVVYDSQNILTFNNSFSHTCKCSINDYFPVCVNGEKTHYSPCTIGCKNQSGAPTNLIFSNCTHETNPSTVTEEVCNTKCMILPLFLSLAFIAVILQHSTYVLIIIYTMRILDFDSKICGLSSQQIILRLSYLVGPVIFGPIIDRSCAISIPFDRCTTARNCINYDLKKLSLMIAIPCITCKIISTLFFLLAGFCSKTIPREIIPYEQNILCFELNR